MSVLDRLYKHDYVDWYNVTVVVENKVKYAYFLFCDGYFFIIARSQENYDDDDDDS